MSQYLDSAVLVAPLVPDDPDHAVCDAILNQSGNWTTLHSLNETLPHLPAAGWGFEWMPTSRQG